MFGSLGAVSFQVLNSPQSQSYAKKYRYEKLPVYQGTPVLQWIYDDLQEVKLEFLFHQQFTNPLAAEQALINLAAAHNAVPYVFANGVNAGNYVIENLERQDIWLSDQGDIIAVRMTCDLLAFSGALPTGGPASIPTVTPGVIGSSAAPQTPLYTGVTTTTPASLPALPVGISDQDDVDSILSPLANVALTQIAVLELLLSEPIYPQILKLPYVPIVGSLQPTTSFGSVPVATALRWGT